MTARKTLFGYCNRLSVRPGDTVNFKVSAYEAAAYDAGLVRIVNGDAVSDADHYREIEVDAPFAGRYQGRFQPTYGGSYVRITETGPLDNLRSFTVQSYVFLTTPDKGEQHLISRWNDAGRRGWALAIDANGCPAFIVGDGPERRVEVVLSRPLVARRWTLLSASIDADHRTVTLAQRPAPLCGADAAPDPESVTAQCDPAALVQAGPLLFAASYDDPGTGGAKTVHLFNGRMDSMRLARTALSPAEIGRAAQPAIDTAIEKHIAGFWDCSRDIGTTRVTDLSANGLHGTTVNLPLRAVRGVHWDGACFDWRQRPEHYGAIHFHDDDLYDCGWETDFTYTVPEDLRSGVYAARLRHGTDGEEYITFFVAGRRGKAAAKVAVMMPTFTYLAYANENYAAVKFPPHIAAMYKQLVNDPDYYDETNAHREFSHSLYQHHTDGSPVHLSSRLRPVLNLKPKSNLYGFSVDTLITAWLEHEGIDYDILTDDIVDDEGVAALSPYDVVITGNHPEYSTARLLDAIETYLGQGGRFMYLGGNGFYWRIALHAELPGVIEVRRNQTGSGTWFSEVGETYHEFSGEHGGIWRGCGRPPQQLFGVGFIAQGFSGSTYYRRQPGAGDPRAAFIVEGVDDEIIGDFGLLGGGAAGEEIDATDFDLGTPSHALIVARSEKHNADMLLVREEVTSTKPFEETRPRVHSDVTFFETPAGGAVFSTGSMAWIGSLCNDDYKNNVAAITTNVLRRFMDDAPFVYPDHQR